MNEQQIPPTPEQALNFLYSATEVANLQLEQRRAVIVAYDIIANLIKKT